MAYLAPTLPTTLFSLCYMQRCGAHYTPDPSHPCTHSIIMSSITGFLLDRSTINPSNLLPIDFTALRKAALANPSSYIHHSPPTSYLLSSPSPIIPHITGAQRLRANQAEALHHALGHPSDTTLCPSASPQAKFQPPSSPPTSFSTERYVAPVFTVPLESTSHPHTQPPHQHQPPKSARLCPSTPRNFPHHHPVDSLTK